MDLKHMTKAAFFRHIKENGLALLGVLTGDLEEAKNRLKIPEVKLAADIATRYPCRVQTGGRYYRTRNDGKHSFNQLTKRDNVYKADKVIIVHTNNTGEHCPDMCLVYAS